MHEYNPPNDRRMKWPGYDPGTVEIVQQQSQALPEIFILAARDGFQCVIRQRPLHRGLFPIGAHPEVAVVRHRQDDRHRLGVNFCVLTRLTFLGSVKKRVPLRASFSRRNIQAAQDVDRIRKPVVSTAYECKATSATSFLYAVVDACQFQCAAGPDQALDRPAPPGKGHVRIS
jgi:hypothetical protein